MSSNNTFASDPASNPILTDSAFGSAPRPDHHVHNSSEPLPGARGTDATTTDYSKHNIEHVAQGNPGAGFDRRPAGPGFNGSSNPASEEDIGAARFTSQSNIDGGVGMDEGLDARSRHESRSMAGAGPHEHEHEEHDGRPVGKAGFTDKVVGKSEQTFGKLAHKPAMAEKGELRATGGKAAVRGDARAPGLFE